MPECTYTEEEVASIFARAAERQRPASTRDVSVGLTLAEIERAGLEAGLDPSAIRAAAAEVDFRQRFPVRSKVAVAERWVATPIPEGAWEDLVSSLRHRFGTNSAWWGQDTASLGEAQEWTHTDASLVRTTITLSPRAERALLRVVQEDAGLEDDRKMGSLMAAFFGLIPSMSCTKPLFGLSTAALRGGSGQAFMARRTRIDPVIRSRLLQVFDLGVVAIWTGSRSRDRLLQGPIEVLGKQYSTHDALQGLLDDEHAE